MTIDECGDVLFGCRFTNRIGNVEGKEIAAGDERIDRSKLNVVGIDVPRLFPAPSFNRVFRGVVNALWLRSDESVLAIGLALFQFWGTVEVMDGDTVTYATNWLRIGIIGGIFGFGQFLEGNILTPKLVGGSVGLHPVWLLFALSVFGSLFGFVGMLVAVPIAAMIGVVTRWGLSQYKGSLLYRGKSKDI